MSIEPGAIRITEGSQQRSLAPALLTRQEVISAGFPEDMTQVKVDEAQLFENPDPRGPCGAKIVQPDFRDAALTSFQSPSEPVAVFHAVWELPQGEAEALLTAVKRDVRPGCPPFESDTPFGGPQTNEFLGSIPLPPVGDDRIALSGYVKGPAGDELYGTTAWIRAGSRLTAVMLFSAQEADDQVVARLVDIATRKLEAMPERSN